MSQDLTVMSKLILTLMTLHQRKASGELVISLSDNPAVQWQIYLYMGRLIYATGGFHPVRRWYRAFKSCCPDYAKTNWVQELKPNSALWEVEVLNQAVSTRKITATQAREVIRAIAQEVFFSFIERQTVNTTWNPGKQVVKQGAFLSIEQVVQETQALRDEWRNSGLGHLQPLLTKFSPDLAPIIRNPDQLKTQVSPQVFQSLSTLMQGNLTLWDVSIAMRKPLPSMMRSLQPLIRQGVISLREIPDIPPPYKLSAPSAAAPPTPQPPVKKPLIACVDDSPAVHQALRKMLEPQGYATIAVEDPLHSIAVLLANKPDLIFLDLVMPSTNGYELCNFLRKTSQFSKVPIIILTSRDKMVDRMRAKQVGASEFLSKPPEVDKVLEAVQRLLKNPTSQSTEDALTIN